MRKPRLLLADDHRMVAEGLRGLLEPDFQLVGIVKDGLALIEAADKLMPDIIVADVSMPLLNGIEAVLRLKRKNKDIVVIFLTMYMDVTYAASAFDAGASGYVLKHSAPSELRTAIQSALKGQKYVPPELAEELREYQRNKADTDAKEGLDLLTSRQRQVLQLIVEGLSVKEAAVLLGISSRTVEFHKYSMMETLGVKSTAELVRFAVEYGMK